MRGRAQPAYQYISTRSYHAERPWQSVEGKKKIPPPPRPPFSLRNKEKGGAAGAFGLVRWMEEKKILS